MIEWKLSEEDRRIEFLIKTMNKKHLDKATVRWRQIEKFLETRAYIMNADVRKLCGVSAPTANRILARLAQEGKLNKCRVGGHWCYKAIFITSTSSFN